MVCRRLLVDDDRGVGEALNETVCTSYGCAGLVVSTPEKNLLVISICFAFLYRSWRSLTFLQHSASIMTHFQQFDHKKSKNSKKTINNLYLFIYTLIKYCCILSWLWFSSRTQRTNHSNCPRPWIFMNLLASFKSKARYLRSIFFYINFKTWE